MGGVKRPARCFIYTDDESLTAAVAEGTVTEHDAQILRGFAALLRVTAAMRARTTRPNGEPMTTYNDPDAAERITEALTSGPLADESSSRAARSGGFDKCECAGQQGQGNPSPLKRPLF